MKIELRVSSYEVLPELLDWQDVDGVSIGSEGCCHKVPNPGEFQKWRCRIESSGKTCILVTPVVPPTCFAAMVSLVREVAETGPATVVVNDWGLLHATEECWGKGGLTAIAGIALSFCGERIVNRERYQEGLKEYMISTRFAQQALDRQRWIMELLDQNSFQSRSRIEFAQNRYNLQGIEEAALPSAVPSLKRIRKMGIQVRIQAGRSPVAISRACAVARYYREQPPFCLHRCEQPIFLKTTGLCRVGAGVIFDDRLEQQLVAEIPEYHVLGNVQYQRKTDRLKDIDRDAVDWVVYDVRAYDRLRLQALVASMKEIECLN